MKVVPLSPAGGVKVVDLDLAGGNFDKSFLKNHFDKAGLVYFPHQNLTKLQLVSAARIFGEPMIFPLQIYLDDEIPEIVVVGTRGAGGDIDPLEKNTVGKIDWHTDYAYSSTPNRGALLYAETVPPVGGLTGFVDRQRAYETLPESLKREIAGCSIIKSWRYAVAKDGKYQPTHGKKEGMTGSEYPDFEHPLTYRHPVTDMNILNISPQWDTRIPNVDPARSDALLHELHEHCLQEANIYWHSYERGDVILWDNWRMMHAASGTESKYHRVMYRVTLAGDVPFGRVLDPENSPSEARLAAPSLG